MVCTPRELEFGRQIAIDFEANADFNECRCCPSHGYPSWFPAKRAFAKQVNRTGICKTRGFFVAVTFGSLGKMPAYPKLTEEEDVCVVNDLRQPQGPTVNIKERPQNRTANTGEE
jgi:hypothetical protein